jgi:hypothetical protein
MQKCMWTDLTFTIYLYMQIMKQVPWTPIPHQQPR